MVYRHSSDMEKTGDSFTDAVHVDDAPSEQVDLSGGFTPTEQKRIIRHIDRRLTFVVGIMYCASVMDRTNMGYANIAGMGTELVLTGTRYNVANLVFFVTYIFFQPPSTIIIRALGPRIHITTITLLWGCCTLGMGFVKNHNQLTALRVLLGCLEAGFFPSIVYLLSTWYTRFEIGTRFSFFYLTGVVASSFSGILAFGLSQLKGTAGLSAWRWIFIIEGLLTVLFAMLGAWLLVDFPDSKRKVWAFLNERETDWIISRIKHDRGDQKDVPFNLKKFLSSAKDWKVWVFAMIAFNSTTISFALSYTLPILLRDTMGFDIPKSQCLVAPPYIFAGMFLMATGWLGDKYHVRGPIIILNMIVVIAGLPLMAFVMSPAVRYFGCFLVTAGISSNIPCALAYQQNNVRGQLKRSFTSGSLIAMSSVGGIAGSLIFRTQDRATGYKPGFYACFAVAGLNIILVLILSVAFKKLNAKADRGEVVLEAHEEDATPDFRYTF